MPTTPGQGKGTDEFGTSTIYRIEIRGVLDDEWEDRLAGMRITIDQAGSDPPRTVLEGPIRDQAELSGVLDTLYGLHMTILSVQRT